MPGQVGFQTGPSGPTGLESLHSHHVSVQDLFSTSNDKLFDGLFSTSASPTTFASLSADDGSFKTTKKSDYVMSLKGSDDASEFDTWSNSSEDEWNTYSTPDAMTTKSEDKSMPFDVSTFAWNSSLATFMVQLTSNAPETDAVSAPTASPASMQDVHSTAMAHDNKLESPLGLNGELDTPLSDLLASPLFSDSSSVMNERGSLSSSTPFDSPALSLFAPLGSGIAPAALSLPDFKDGMFASPASLSESTVPDFSTVHVPPNTPMFPSLDQQPKTAAHTRPRASRQSSVLSNTHSSVPTPTTIPLDAPIQTRNYVIPSSTSRKRKTIAVERALAKRGKVSDDTASTPSKEGAAAADDDDDVPDDLVAAVERKRLQNTLSARRARQRKAEHLATLETENAQLRAENDELRRRLAKYEDLA